MKTQVYTGRDATTLAGEPFTRIVLHGDSECWYEYLIAPRAAALQRFRKARAEGYSREGAYVMAFGLDRFSAHYGGPGRAFCSRLSTRAKNRRFYVFQQRGGLDI